MWKINVVCVDGAAGSDRFREEHPALGSAAPRFHWWRNLRWRRLLELCASAQLEDGLWCRAAGESVAAETLSNGIMMWNEPNWGSRSVSVLNRKSLFWPELSAWTWIHMGVTVTRSCGGSLMRSGSHLLACQAFNILSLPLCCVLKRFGFFARFVSSGGLEVCNRTVSWQAGLPAGERRQRLESWAQTADVPGPLYPEQSPHLAAGWTIGLPRHHVRAHAKTFAVCVILSLHH